MHKFMGIISKKLCTNNSLISGDPVVCTKGFVKEGDKCVKPSKQTNTWVRSVLVCNEQDGTLINVDSDGDEASLRNILQNYGISELIHQNNSIV